MVQRLDIKSVRYDRLNRSVLIDGRKVVLVVSHEALEELKQRPLDDNEAMFVVAQEVKKLTRLAERVPADDGKIQITSSILVNDGIFGAENGG